MTGRRRCGKGLLRLYPDQSTQYSPLYRRHRRSQGRAFISTGRNCCPGSPAATTSPNSSGMRRDTTRPVPSPAKSRLKPAHARRRWILSDKSILYGAIFTTTCSRLLRRCAPRNDKQVSLRAQRSNLEPDSAQHPDFLSLDQVEVDVGTEAGLGRGVDESVALDGDVFGEAVFLHCVR